MVYYGVEEQVTNCLRMSLHSAKAKLEGHILFGNLPSDRNDSLWSEIRHECRLTLDELAALKKATCVGELICTTPKH